MIGCDYASVDKNAPPNASAAKTAGVTFAIVRGSYKTWTDPTARRDAEAWRAAGVTFGAYMFPVLDRGAPSPAEQVRAFARSGAVQKFDLPPTLDVEFPGGIKKTGRTRAELLGWVLEAVAEMKREFGCSPFVYTSARVWDGDDSDSLDADKNGFGALHPTMSECPLWLARYPYKTRLPAIGDTREERKVVDALPWPPVPRAWGDAHNVWIHQYQGDALKMPGFTSTVDLNRFRSLARGEAGERVRWLQRRVKLAEGTPGIFDEALEDAVREVQSRAGLVADGVVGPRTFARVAWA